MKSSVQIFILSNMITKIHGISRHIDYFNIPDKVYYEKYNQINEQGLNFSEH